MIIVINIHVTLALDATFGGRIVRGFFGREVDVFKIYMLYIVCLSFDFQDPHGDRGVFKVSFVEVKNHFPLLVVNLQHNKFSKRVIK